MKKIKILVLSLAVIIFLLSSCSPRKERIKIAGSTTVLPIVQAAAEEYMELNPNVNITVRGGGSSIGIHSILGDVIDIGNASRKVKNNEEKLLAENENLVETAIALDALSVIVNNSNIIDSISCQDLKKIFQGEITNWDQIGGKDMDIVVISRDISSGSFEVFNDVILQSDNVTSGAMMLPSNNAVATTAGNTPGAIGYVGLGFTSSQMIKSLWLDGVYPSEDSAQKSSYKLTRHLYMYTQRSADENTAKFIDFLLSAQGQTIVKEQGYVKINN